MNIVRITDKQTMEDFVTVLEKAKTKIILPAEVDEVRKVKLILLIEEFKKFLVYS